MAVAWTWSGAQTDDGFRVTAKLNAAATQCRLKVSTVEALTTAPVYSPLVAVDANGYVKMEVAGLNPDVRYFYGIEVDGVVDAWRGRCRTFPADGDPASFRFGFGSCSTHLSRGPVWKRVANRDLLFFQHLGDWHYWDLAANDQAAARLAIETAMSKPERAALLRDTAMPYTWDNHDCLALDTAALPANQAVYAQVVPSYDLPGDGSIYHDFRVGRVPFIVTDHRTALTAPGVDGPSSTVLGATQLAWFKAKLLSYADAPVIFWCSSKSWYGLGPQSWSGGYTAERDEIAEFIEANDLPPVVILSGDLHYNAYHPGQALSVGGRAMPEHISSPMDNTSSVLEESEVEWTSGPWRNASGNSQYSTVEVHDDGTNCRWTVRAWRCMSGIKPSDNLYVVHSDNSTEAPRLLPAVVRDAVGVARPVEVDGTPRPVYAFP